MNLSVIIPTYNGKEKIINLINSLLRQSTNDFEVIIVIDGSTDNTRYFIENKLKKFAKAHIIEQGNRGRAGARNTGAEYASGKYLAFFDDDVILTEKLLQKYEDIIEKTGNDIIVGNLTENYQDYKEFHSYCTYLNNKWQGQFEEGIINKPYITANNFVISKTIFKQVGGFDERLSDAEDFDLAVRLFELGHMIYFSRQLVVKHQLFNSFKIYIRRQIEYGKAAKNLIKINPKASNYKNINNIHIIKKTFYLLLKPKIWTELMEQGFFKVLPKAIRFRLYDKIIYAQKLFNS